LLIGIKVVHADGTISKAGGKVTKNVTGYDMMKLYIGSLGTLAVIVEATLKLRPLPPTQQVVWAAFAAVDAAWTAAHQLLTSQLLPSAVELVNPAVSALLQQTIAGPEGVERWSLLVGVDGAQLSVARQVRELEGICRRAGMTAWWTGTDDGRLWQALQTRFRPQGVERKDRLVIRAGTLRTQVLAVLDRLTQVERIVNVPVELAARLGNGILYGALLLDGKAEQAASLAHALTEIRAQLAAMHGYLVLESAPPSIKAQFDCWGDLGPQAQVMGELKREFDPRRVLNPGRFVNGL
jgi:glycolate dehydrogenase FAD-binding subunit